MRRTGFVFAAFIFLLAFFQIEASAETTASHKRTSEEEKKVAEMRKRSSEKRKELNGSKWEVFYVSSSDPKLKGKKDAFIFQDGVFTSEAFSKRGFSPTNYTVTVSPEEASETGVWETMQTGKDGRIFVRGEWIKDKMSGNITEQLEGGKKTLDHSFSTSSREAIPADSKKKEETPIDEASEPEKGASALVSKEGPAEEAVASFLPGTTDESR